MITERDLEEAIMECKGQKNPTSSTCIKLAAFLTIQRELYGEKPIPSYSFSPASDDSITASTGTEFANAINSKHFGDVFPVLDELMTTLGVIHPRLYNAVMDKLNII